MAEFWEDPLKLHEQLADEEKLIHQTARDFCQEKLLPGIIEGPRIERVIADRAQATGVETETMRARYLERISLRRMTPPEDIAALVVFLLSPAGRNLSGQSFGVDGNVETL